MDWAEWFREHRTAITRVTLLICLSVIFLVGALMPFREKPMTANKGGDLVALLASNFGFNDLNHRFSSPITSKEGAISVAQWVCSGPNGEKAGELAQADLSNGVWRVRSRETTDRGDPRLSALMRADGRGHPICFRQTPPCPTKPGTSCDLGITAR
jgi:hypothetical protein